jgi:hypothetical protein
MSASWVFFLILFMLCEPGLQADGRHFEQTLWFKVRIINLKSVVTRNTCSSQLLAGRKILNFSASLLCMSGGGMLTSLRSVV